MKGLESLIKACQIPVDENGNPRITIEFLDNLRAEATHAYVALHNSEKDRVVSDALALYGDVLSPDSGWVYSPTEMNLGVDIHYEDENVLARVTIYKDDIYVYIRSRGDFDGYAAFELEKCEPDKLKERLLLGIKCVVEMCGFVYI